MNVKCTYNEIAFLNVNTRVCVRNKCKFSGKEMTEQKNGRSNEYLNRASAVKKLLISLGRA